MLTALKRLFNRAWNDDLGSESEEKLVEIEERLQKIEADDKKVRSLERRVERIIVENNLAPAIIRALKLR
jgi:hypothetical protein